jgi:hypothetical protein
MENLHYDLQHVENRRVKPADVELDVTEGKTPREMQMEGVEFSKKILSVLEAKLKSHNSTHSKRVRLHQLRSVFCNGVKAERNPEAGNTENGLARVNLFLRIASGNIEDINLDFNKKPSYNKLVDITDHFVPSSEDFDKAKSDIENYDLDYPYEDIEELYLDNDQTSSNLYFDY